jgi:hypothetical protein
MIGEDAGATRASAPKPLITSSWVFADGFDIPVVWEAKCWFDELSDRTFMMSQIQA